MAIYFIIFIGLFLVAVHFNDRKDLIPLLLIGGFLFLFAGFRGDKVDGDYSTYIDYFDRVKHLSISESLLMVEPSFVFITHIVPNIRYVMVIFAFLAVFIHILAFKKVSSFPYFSVALWVTHYFFVHEMNQVRAGVAIGLVLFSLYYVQERKLYKFLLVIGIATLFHYSAIVLIPVYFLSTVKMNRIYFLIIPVSYVLFLGGLGLLEILGKLHIGIIQSKIEAYNTLQSVGMYTKINVFNPAVMLRIVLIYIFLFNNEYLKDRNPHFIIMVKMYVLSIAFMVLFASMPAFALRFADVFGIVELALVPMLFYLLDYKYLVLTFVFGWCLLFLFLDLIYNGFLNPYYI
ncbi:EpsG family protein [Chitinophaga silvisoli]|uniref:EpsG family protein n=1 Tax=Chitinophaga silvisoli TaxID=2291814 RepID=A0A3E1P741_9BACT|nr:EpsG family protein [Chitinophaga silvisoli]RFM35848.1 EpsG family protein [Chitinophaga silvisoli]